MVTKCMTRFHLSNLNDSEPQRSAVRLWDSWGVDTASDFKVKDLLKGNYGNGSEKGYKSKPSKPLHPDCVIVFLPFAAYKEKTEQVSTIKQIVQQLRSFRIGVLLAMSKVDEIYPQLRGACVSNEEMWKTLSEASFYFKVNVLPFYNYQSEKTTCRFVNLNIFDVLYAASTKAASNKI